MSNTLNVRLMSRGAPIPYGPAVPGIHLAFGQGNYDQAAFRHYCDPAGAVSIELLPDGPYRLHARAKGYLDPAPVDLVLPSAEWAGQVEVALEPAPAPPLPRLVMQGELYMNVFIQGSTGYSDYWRWLEGDTETLHHVWGQNRRVGANGRAVLMMMHWIQVNSGRKPFHPQDYGQRFYDQIPSFLDDLNRYGQYGYLIWCADTGIIMPKTADQVQHINQGTEAAKSRTNAFINPVNEQDAHENGINLWELEKPSGIVSVCGSFSYNSPYQPHLPQWDLYDWHTPRKLNASVKDQNVLDHPARQKDRDYRYPAGWTPRGVIVMEPQKFGIDPRTGIDYGRDPALARMMGVGSSRGTAAGTAFHSPYGTLSLPYPDDVIACFRAWQGLLE